MLPITNNIPLAPKTTFYLGGPAKYFYEAKDRADLEQAINWANQHSVPYFLLGGGSNILVADQGYNGLVIKLAASGIQVQKNTLIADAGAALADVIAMAQQNALSGLESLAGIPGTMGGAIRGNAGAFGTEIKDCLQEVAAFNATTKQYKTFSKQDCQYGYRGSFFKHHPEWLILQGHLALSNDEPKKIQQRIEATVNKRNKKQIQNIKSAGSMFINPVASDERLRNVFEKEAQTKSRGGRIPAGWLIDKAGLRNAAIGEITTSAMHPNYFINLGHGTAGQAYQLLQLCHDKVRQQFSIDLQTEIQLLGFDT